MPKDLQPRFLPTTEAEWTGLFLFLVGLYGSLKQPLMRHYELFGKVPADWFYLGLLGVGGGLLLAAGPFAARREEGPLPLVTKVGYAFRVVAAVGLVAFMTYRVVMP